MFRRIGSYSLARNECALVGVAPLRENLSPQTGDIPVDVFQVLDLPLNIHEASLTKTERGYLLKLSLSNSSDLKIIGLRYSLVSIDARNEVQIRVNRTEGLSMPAYGMKTLTFKTPIRLKQKDGERFVLMIEQVVSRESIWEVVKAKEALEAYAQRRLFCRADCAARAESGRYSADGRAHYFRKN